MIAARAPRGVNRRVSRSCGWNGMNPRSSLTRRTASRASIVGSLARTADRSRRVWPRGPQELGAVSREKLVYPWRRVADRSLDPQGRPPQSSIYFRDARRPGWVTSPRQRRARSPSWLPHSWVELTRGRFRSGSARGLANEAIPEPPDAVCSHASESLRARRTSCRVSAGFHPHGWHGARPNVGLPEGASNI